jgi:hypothetical protein
MKQNYYPKFKSKILQSDTNKISKEFDPSYKINGFGICDAYN